MFFSYRFNSLLTRLLVWENVESNLTQAFNFVSVLWGVVLLKTAWHGTAPHLLPAWVVCLFVPCHLLDSVPLRSFWFPHLHHYCNSTPTDNGSLVIFMTRALELNITACNVISTKLYYLHYDFNKILLLALSPHMVAKVLEWGGRCTMYSQNEHNYF